MPVRFWLLCLSVVCLSMYGMLSLKKSTPLSSEQLTSLIAQPTVIEARHDAKISHHPLQLLNSGRVPIHIVEMKTTCGCTLVSEVPDQPIAPGQKCLVKVRATPPGFGEMRSYLTIRTEPALPHPLVVTVKLFGKELPVPFVSHAPEIAQLSGTEPSAEAITEFEVQTVELIDAPLFLKRQQCDHEGLRIWFEDDPLEEPLFDGKVRRIYKMKVAGSLPASDIETTKDRHLIVTETTVSQPPKSIIVESRVKPLVKIVPSVVNLTVRQDGNSNTECVVALIDSRGEGDRKPLHANVDVGWVQVAGQKIVEQPDRLIQTFRLTILPMMISNELRDATNITHIRFQSESQSETVLSLPVRVRFE